MNTTENKILQIYVKSTSNCQGMTLTNFEILSDTWTGDSVKVRFENARGTGFKKIEVVGWTDLFFGSPCPVSITKVKAPDESIGYLIHGGNSGLKLSAGYGVPIIWIDDEKDLPKEVLKIVGK